MTSKPKNDQALALRDERIEAWRDPEWQRLWLAMQVRPWRSLAIVPAGAGVPADFSLRIAVALARTGMVHLGGPVQVADATKVPLAYLAPFLEQVRRCTEDGDRILVAVAPTNENPITVSVAQAVDAALLCILMEQTETAHAKKTVALIGASRFVGSAVLRADALPADTQLSTTR